MISNGGVGIISMINTQNIKCLSNNIIILVFIGLFLLLISQIIVYFN